MAHNSRLNPDTMYIERVSMGAGNRRKIINPNRENKWRNWWLVKARDSNTSYCGYINLNGRQFCLPQGLIGRKVRLRLEIIEEVN